MANLPLILSLIDELDREAYNPSYYGHDFGFGLHPQHIHRQPQRHHREVAHPTNLVGYTLPLGLWNRHHRAADKKNTAGPLSAIGKDGFQVCMDVAQFKPSELSVKVVENCVVVEGKHEEREDDHGHISRHFVRRYTLPKDYDAEKVVSTLSSDGVLTVSVPKPPQLEDKSKERIVTIQQTGPAHLNIKDNSSEKTGDAANGSNGDSAEK